MPERTMKKALIWLTANWHVAAFLIGFHAFAWFLLANWSRNSSAQMLVYALALVTLGLLCRRKWARYAGVAVLIAMILHKAYGFITLDFNWSRVWTTLLYVYGAYLLWTAPNESFLKEWGLDDSEAPTKDDKETPPKPMISLVHLRSQPRYLEPVVLANALSEAWDAKIFGGEGDPPDDADGFVAGDGPMYMVMRTKPSFAMFMVHNHDRSYFDDPEAVAKAVTNLRYAQIIREHSAWLAVDLMQVADTAIGQDEAYRMIGKAVSALADDDVMAIMCPQHRFFNLWSPELEKLLCGDSPLDALREEVKAPVFGVPNGEVIENAIAEARRRWPEFATAFKNREPGDDRFIVKAPFVGEDGETEHMWLQVFGLEPEYVHGHLANHPMHTTKLKQGSQVEVPVAEISDWVCPDAEGNALGNFTHQAVKAAAKPQAEA
jgi:uncharacterized protein YegJ (DUF2314 family)